MADEFAEHLLVSSLAHMCRQQGWHQASRSGLSLFSDIAQRYIRNIGILTLRYSLHGGRFDPDLDDLGNAFSDLGIRLSDLRTMWSETEPNRGLPQVCSFPSQPTLNLNIPEASSNQSDYIPDYLPSRTIEQASPVKDEEKTVKEDSTVAAKEAAVEPTVDPFDEAAAAPTPSAPNFPFVNKTDLPAPVMSSWGFQRVTINTAPSQIPNSVSSKPEKQPRSSPDNFHITENSDDFVFASKHSKSKEEKSKDSRPKENEFSEDKSKGNGLLQEGTSKEDGTMEEVKHASNELQNSHNDLLEVSKSSGDSSTLVDMDTSSKSDANVRENHVDGKPLSQESHDDSMFLPSMGTSTPLVSSEKLPTIKNGQNGVDCRQKLFNHSPKPPKNHSPVTKDSLAVETPSKSETPLLKNPVVTNANNINDSDSEDFNDFGFGGSSSDDAASKENFDRLLKPLSPMEGPETSVISNVEKSPKSPKSPASKRRKLDSPASPSINNSEKNLLKNRPDLIKNDVISKPKAECKLLNNHNSVSKKSAKTDKIDKNHHNKKVDNQKYSKLLKQSLNHGTGIKNRHKPKKLKKKEVSQSIDLFDDRPIKIPNHKTDKPKKSSEKNDPVVFSKTVVNPASPKLSVIEPMKLKIAPITLSIPKKDKEPVPKKDPPVKPATPPLINTEKTTSLKISLKNVKNSKIKSKSTIDSEDDFSSLSSDSLDGFEDLLPKKSQKVKTTSDSKSDKRTFKTKAELKNPWPPSESSQSIGKKSEPSTTGPVVETERKKQKSGGVTTKIKIGKPGVTQPSAVSMTSPKPSMKLKLNISSSSENVDQNSSVYSQPSLRIDESLAEKEEEKPPIASLKIPKIKIKIGGNSLKSPDSPASFSSSTINSPEPAPIIPIKPLKIKLPDPGSLSIKPEPVPPKSPAPIVKKEKKEKKPKKVKAEPKSSKSSEKPPSKPEKPLVIKPDPIPEPFDTPITPLLESSLVSETVVSETVAQTGGEAIKIWYCPSCMLPDDGSPMVGCDKCDEWYHWPCVGLAQAPPDDCDWFCPPCKKLLNKPSKGRKPGGKRKRKT